MKPHDTYLQLAAMAIDYPLPAADHGRLEAHLAGCQACARRASAFRGDALAMGHLPAVILPERRGADILAAALHPATTLHPVRLLVLAALLGLLLVGSLAVGAQLLRGDDDDLSVVVPPVATASPGPEASAGPEQSATPSPTTVAAAGEILVDFGDMVTVRIIDTSGRDVGQAPYGSVGPVAAWSPNGATVAYTISTAGKQAVVIWDATSATEVGRIAGAHAPSWSPDGTQLAYCLGDIANPGDPCPEVWLAGATGTNARRLGGGWHGPLPWSPDGRWLLGPTLGTGTPEPFQLIDVATGKATPLGDPRGCYELPAWLPGPSAAGGDGLTVVAIRDPGCTAMFPTPTVIVALDVATGGESRLTDGTAADGGLAVSPDGRSIAVGRSLTGQPGSPYGVVVMASDGSGARVLTPAGVSDSGPLWSPDGARILVQREQLVDETTGAPLGLGLQLIDPTSSATIAVPGTTGATGWAWRPSPTPSTEPSPSPVPEPSSAPTAAPTAGASGELVAVLDVRCGPGAPELGSDRVRASRDGVRIRVTGEPGWLLGIDDESRLTSVPLEAAVQELVLSVAPGNVTIHCGDPTLPDLPPASALRIEDPDGWYRPMSIGDGVVGSCVSGNASYGNEARGKSTDPVKQARELLRGLQAGDVVERAGYATDKGWVRVVRADEVIGVLEFNADGHGGWLLMGSTLCGNLSG